ncbi:hypothetical protein PQB85_gp45 [Erwinia phage Midgardsormr38]|uniref:Uncharacterized protein n=1 Tax=Erwinia phage Midgardsormr38 TaxID=2663326 RepID=A0A5Q2F4K1_9CAUD|nr:hypothetical protein PQB85_gp45 [Erwinia phage Midgardsormr38]QGF22002.1 hypothetical protein [Erwinia phage Midgardsormr38]
MSKEKALQPKYAVGVRVVYVDRHGREQSGVVREVTGHWRGYRAGPSLSYSVGHPTYQNGVFYCGEDAISGEFKL